MESAPVQLELFVTGEGLAPLTCVLKSWYSRAERFVWNLGHFLSAVHLVQTGSQDIRAVWKRDIAKWEALFHHCGTELHLHVSKNMRSKICSGTELDVVTQVEKEHSATTFALLLLGSWFPQQRISTENKKIRRQFLTSFLMHTCDCKWVLDAYFEEPSPTICRLCEHNGAEPCHCWNKWLAE
eukprot:1849303-Amphidinium_carterae.1